MRIESFRWPELGNASDKIFVAPLGSIEQHGLHLPLGTDTMIVSEIAARVERELSDRVVLLPTQWLGHSPHHRRFGCVSLDQMPYIAMIQGLCRSLVGIGARKILLLNGHGGNDIPCKAALRELKHDFAERPDVYITYAAYWNLAASDFMRIRTSAPGGMGHACEMETSVMLAVHRDLVAPAPHESGGPVNETGYRMNDMLVGQPYYIVNEFDEISRNGAIGLPEQADAAKGERFLTAATSATTQFLNDFATWNYQERSTRPSAGSGK